MADEFKPNVGKQVYKSDAIKWKDKYDKERKKDTESVFFGRDAILAILSQAGCSGISFLFVRKKNDESSQDETDKNYKDDLVMVGTTEEGKLLWTDSPPATTTTATLTSGSNTYDNSTTCPPYCPK